MEVVCCRKGLELLRLCSISVFKDQPFQLIYRVEQINTTSSVCISRLEEPHVVSVKQGLTHRDRCRLSLSLAIGLILLNASVHLSENFLLCSLVGRI